MSKGTIISLCDLTGIMAEPWIRNGYDVILVDPQHDGTTWLNEKGMVLLPKTVEEAIPDLRKVTDCKMVFAFPPCTDLAVSGAAHFESKRSRDVHFQAKALMVVEQCKMVGEMLGVPYFIENPVSVISSAWRKPDYTFHPYEYGGYLSVNDEHPLYPEYIAPRDAYPKKTCLWVGGGFKMPIPKVVIPVEGYSKQHLKLGGRSLKTKNIRSCTPRGFAQATYEANK